MQLSSPTRRYTKEGKTAKVVTVTLINLGKPGGNGATPALDNMREGIAHREDQSVRKVDPNRRDFEERLLGRMGMHQRRSLRGTQRHRSPYDQIPVIPRILYHMKHRWKRRTSSRRNE